MASIMRVNIKTRSLSARWADRSEQLHAVVRTGLEEDGYIVLTVDQNVSLAAQPGRYMGSFACISCCAASVHFAAFLCIVHCHANKVLMCSVPVYNLHCNAYRALSVDSLRPVPLLAR